MAKGASGYSSFAEGQAAIIQAISLTFLAPDAQPHWPLLEQIQKAVTAAGIQKPQGGQKPPGGPPGAPPGAGGPPPGGAPPGGGGPMNLASLQGQGGGGPSAAASGGPSPSGISSDDLRRMMADDQGD